MNMREKDVEKKLKHMVMGLGGLCLKWVCPGWSGVPDRIILLPQGKVMFVELKRPKGGEVSELQRWWLDRLTKLGFYAVLCYDDEDIRAIELLITAMLRR